jgi:mono/diheme cytochrome c family protein
MRRIALAASLFLALVAAKQRVVRPPAVVAAGGPTFNKEIVRIFQARCQSCHHPGDIAPFSLMTYADAYPQALPIKLMTKTRKMPPWKATAACGDFADERVMSQEEIDLIAKWVDNGAPEGIAADLPPPLQFSGGWALGEPDLVLSYPEPYTPPATGDMYRCFPIPTSLIADQYVAAVDVKPGDAGTVHHVIAYLDTTGASQKLDDDDPGPGYTSFGGPGFSISNPASATLGGWAPGARPTTLPEGVAMSLPANSRVVLQVHYHPHHGAPGPDTTRIGIYFSKEKPKKLLRILPLINDAFTIPPNDPNYRVTASFTVPPFLDSHAWIIAPHMHLLGRKMRVEARLPNGQTRCLINIDDWDFNWQGMYRYNNAVALPAGTRVSLEAFYDNSSANPRNPNDPPKSVSWGEETTDEMCIAFLGVTIDLENLN